MDPSSLAFVSASEAAQAILERRITSMELTKHILERIDQYNPELNAVVTLMYEKALDRARAEILWR